MNEFTKQVIRDKIDKLKKHLRDSVEAVSDYTIDLEREKQEVLVTTHQIKDLEASLDA